MIKKCAGFDMNILCYDPAYQDQKFVESVRRVMKVRHDEGLATRPQTIEQVIDTVVARVLDHMGVPQTLVSRWQEEKE